MQKLQWHHCPYNDCDLKFKSKSNLKHHTDSHAALDSGLTFPCDECDYVSKTGKHLADHKQRHKKHKCNYAGCGVVFDHRQKLINHKKKENHM